jgi:RNA polymerase sigma-70 factor, ECF subfamily
MDAFRLWPLIRPWAKPILLIDRPIAAESGGLVENAVGAEGAPHDVGGGLDERLEGHRAELVGYCSRILGSRGDAEDAVQDALVRAWRGHHGLENRAALRSWLYRIATNVCFNHLHRRRRVAHPVDLGPNSSAEWVPDPAVQAAAWIAADPADAAVALDEIRLAFAVAFGQLPPRQRAVLILREVLRWQAKEVADFLGTTVPSVNSALQRARATLSARHYDDVDAPAALDAAGRASVARLVDAFARHDLDTLVAILREDVRRPMPRCESPRALMRACRPALASPRRARGITEKE